MADLVYDDKFYRRRHLDTQYAAMKILSIVTDGLSITQDSIVDIGCGVGTWLKVGKENFGFQRAVGIDGSYVPKKYLQISKEEFVPANLENYSVNKILKINNNHKFSIAISMEVAEHITPKKRGAVLFVEKLCALSDIICFSAALPEQGGDAHVNERRLSYWKNIFEQFGYEIYDVIRPSIWNDKKIPVWYRSNAVIFYNIKAEKTFNKDNIHIKPIIDVVHPDMFEKKVRELKRQNELLIKNRNIHCIVKEHICDSMNKMKKRFQ